MTCEKCGCTDEDCSGCVERTGERCCWIKEGLCSACVTTPGSTGARAKGCKCPVMDNASGRGMMCIEGIYAMRQDCPVHGAPPGHNEPGEFIPRDRKTLYLRPPGIG